MATVCYSWDDAPFKWMETPFTWAEGCVIEKIVGGYGAIPRQKVIERLTNLTDEEKETLIQLFVRLDTEEIHFEKRVNKNKNTKRNTRCRTMFRNIVKISNRRRNYFTSINKIKIDCKK